MKTIIILKYLFSSFFLILVSFIISYHFWWRIDLNSPQFFIIVLSTMICWIGILFLSILISIKSVFKNIEKIGLVSPFQLGLNEYFLEKYGLEIAKKFKKTVFLIAFPILFLLILSFYRIVNFIEYTDIIYYGIEKNVIIEKTFSDKRGKVAQVKYIFNGENYKKNLILLDTLKKAGDIDTIIMSTRNPYIAKFKK